MRTAPKATDRRIHSRRAPAAFLGLSLAVFAACSTALADNPAAAHATAPVVCEIALDAVPGGTRIAGRVTADQAVAGSYTMQITSRSAGGSASISQSGDFAAAAGRTETIAETQLTGTPASQSVDLAITVAGRRLTCADPAL